MNTSHPALLDFDALANWLGYQQPGAVAKALRERGIDYTTDKRGRPVTTADAVTAGIRRENEKLLDFA